MFSYLHLSPLLPLSPRAQAKKELDATNAEVERIERLMAELNAKFETAKEERAILQAETDLMMKRLDAADRLINGLASENERLEGAGRDCDGDDVMRVDQLMFG